MLALIQRVLRARVTVGGETVGSIGRGFLVLLCAEQGDTPQEAEKLLAKILKLRVFGDDQGKMQFSLSSMDGKGTSGGLLVVSQFTLAADTNSGNRPGFTRAAAPAEGRRLYNWFVEQAQAAHPDVQTGRFATEMQVELVNDGPVTIPMRVAPTGAAARDNIHLPT